MRRREFIIAAGATALSGRTALSQTGASVVTGTAPKASDIKDYLWSLDRGWMNFDKTVDVFKAGDPKTEVKGIAVGWMPYEWAIRRALELGCNMFVTHEPTYYDHWDKNQDVFKFDCARRKRELVEKSGIVILRCHDLWDQYPEEGVPDSWARTLGFSQPVDGKGWFRVFDVSGRTAIDVARQVAKKTAYLGQDCVQLLGDENRKVTRAAIGCGAITPFQQFVETYRADLAICTDDGFTYWQDGALALDMGIPVIIVNHPVAEDYSMKTLADHLKKKYPALAVHYIPEGCMYRTVRA
jgi:putative NIF3 family GTP cyclohydrolase 1 type 2